MRNNSKMIFILFLMCLATPAFAATSTTILKMATGIAGGLCSFRTLIYTILPTLSLILFLFAGLAYASGQVFGSETRAKAQGWAMSLLVGGIIGIFIAVLAPILVTIFAGMDPSGKLKAALAYCT